MCFCALAAGGLWGCGDTKTAGSTGATQAPTAVTGATAAGDTTTSGTTTGPTGGSTGSTATQPSEPQKPAGDEEGARTPVVITIENGRFSDKTPVNVHVPSYIAIELDVGLRDSEPQVLTITRQGGGATRKTVKPGYTNIQLEGLRPGKSLSVALGGSRLTVIADAEPGP
ncbi:MAG: hypothetical protein HY827_08280 [Actinobacteria bacterium]|nr:hypothetical protein [Actinomycetota bacterium]